MINQTFLQFPTILVLVDFQLITNTIKFEINTVELTLTGHFSEADPELVQQGLGATVIKQIHSL